MKKLLFVIIILLIIFGTYTGVKYYVTYRETQKVQAQDKPKEEPQDTQQLTGNSDFDKVFAPTQYTPKTYVPPKYDPFSNKYNPNPQYTEIISPIKNQPDILPVPDFTIVPQKQGFTDQSSGTVGTKFLFNASSSIDKETVNSSLQVRWDFEGDGTLDTYFSVTKAATHTYDQPGKYNVTLEVLDEGGNVAKISKPVMIVNNSAPTAYFIYSPTQGTQNTVIHFDTSRSYDSQYNRNFLQYRFDWDSDGVWDTKFEQKTSWNHKFSKAGVNNVTMEAKDPEDLTDQTHAEVTIIENTPPTANISVQNQNNLFYFDATGSSDNESPSQLFYRWDFNYTGTDDIVFDTQFSSSKKVSGNYNIPGHKVIRLQVKDLDGAVSEAFADLQVTQEESR